MKSVLTISVDSEVSVFRVPDGAADNLFRTGPDRCGRTV